MEVQGNHNTQPVRDTPRTMTISEWCQQLHDHVLSCRLFTAVQLPVWRAHVVRHELMLSAHP